MDNTVRGRVCQDTLLAAILNLHAIVFSSFVTRNECFDLYFSNNTEVTVTARFTTGFLNYQLASLTEPLQPQCVFLVYLLSAVAGRLTKLTTSTQAYCLARTAKQVLSMSCGRSNLQVLFKSLFGPPMCFFLVGTTTIL